MTPLRVVVVMPPATHLDPAAALELWPTFTKALEALRASGTIDPVGCCRGESIAGVVERHGVQYYFESSDRNLARRVGSLHPAVVHIHGLGFTRLLVAVRRAVGSDVPILLQHHGEPPPTSARGRLSRRLTRHMVDGYLFTGAAGQVEPFRRSGTISSTASVYEVLESASHLPAGDLDGHAADVQADIGGNPCVLWVGRLVSSKDPLCAVRAVAWARDRGSAAELHMLATDRTMEPDVRSLVDSLGADDFVHIHPPIEHADMPAWYRRGDVYLSTSHHEGSNYSLIEALGFGCFPVVTSIPPHAAIVKELARTFAVGDSDAAGELLLAPAMRSRQEVIGFAHQWLSWATIADQLTAIYLRRPRS